MGCQIYSSLGSINYSKGAWLVAEMCSLWFNAERDMDDPKYGQQCSVDSTSFIQADKVLPNTLNEYILWRRVNDVDRYDRDSNPIDEYDFLTARDFVKLCAENSLDAGLSH